MKNLEILDRDIELEDLEKIVLNINRNPYSQNKQQLFSGKRILISMIAGTLTLGSMPTSHAFSIPTDSENIEEYLNTYRGIISISKEIEKIGCSKNKKEIILKEIISFKSLVENWDGYGAYPLEVESATNAIILLNHFSSEIISTLDDVYPNPNGTVSFEWKNNMGEIILLEVGNQKMSYYVEMSNSPTIYRHNIHIKNGIKELSQYISKLF